MEEKLILYSLAGITIVIAAFLLAYRLQLLSRLTNKQIEAIFGLGQTTEVELSTVEQTVIKMKTRYPALIFLVPATVFAFLGHHVEVVNAGNEDWTIKGKFEAPEGNSGPINWSDGVLTIRPTAIKKTDVGENGNFEIIVSVPTGKLFEDWYDFFEYSSFDKKYQVTVLPDGELAKYQSGNRHSSLLTHMKPNVRIYDEIPVKFVSGHSD